jgi:hypothetical protein
MNGCVTLGEGGSMGEAVLKVFMLVLVLVLVLVFWLASGPVRRPPRQLGSG